MDGESGASLEPRGIGLGRVTPFFSERWPDIRACGLGIALVLPLAASNGGYFPTAWGWSSLGLLWLCALALALSSRRALTLLEWGLVGGLFALFAWILASVLWAPSATDPVLESERALVYVAGALAGLLLVRPRSRGALITGVWAAIVGISVYSLATRLLPERLGVFDPIAGYRLSEPIGYWNGLGLLVAMGSLLALGLAARTRSPALRALAAASLLALLPTLYFTFSRGAWIALAAGLIAGAVMDSRRLQLMSVALIAAPGPAIGIFLAWRFKALNQQDALLRDASREGHRLALILVLLALVGAGLTLLRSAIEARVNVGRRLRLATGTAVVLVVIAALIGISVRYGSPPSLARNAYHAFQSPPRVAGTNLNARLFNFSGSGRVTQWRVAWHQYQDHPVLGYGAGTYERYWNAQRPVAGTIKDVHNLYLEVLAELGPIGLALLVVALGAPLLGAVRARRHPLTSAALAAYVAYLVHAIVDWDWELSGVTLAAVFCGVALVLPVAREVPAISSRWRIAWLAPILALASLGFVGLIGNVALADADRAAGLRQWNKVASEALRAHRWAPWSTEPLHLLAEAQYARDDLAAARSTLREALAKDPANWQLWFNLSAATQGEERAVALAEATRLNPLSPQIAVWRNTLPKVAK